MTVEWRGRPIWIINRTPEMIERTEALGADSLSGPDSEVPQQPAYIQGGLRFIKPEIGVLDWYLHALGLFAPVPT